METKTEQGTPKTVGELRRRLAELGNPWQVHPRFGDDDPLPNPPRGGQREEEIPEEHRLKPLPPGTDIPSQIAAEPPINPFLRLRWLELGLLNQDAVEGLAPDSGENEWGAA